MVVSIKTSAQIGLIPVRTCASIHQAATRASAPTGSKWEGTDGPALTLMSVPQIYTIVLFNRNVKTRSVLLGVNV